MDNYKICIPSFKRSKEISKRTLAFLEKHSISKNKIFIFVCEDDFNDYKNILNNEYNLIKSVKGCKENREFISNYFNENDKLVYFDDDLKNIIYHDKTELDNLDFFIKDSYNYLISNNLRMIGVNPSKNPFFYNSSISNDLKFIQGAFRIVFNTKICEKRNFNLLEDYETCIKYYNFCNGIGRYNNLGLIVNYNSLKGGLKEYRTEERKKKEVEDFYLTYPNFCNKKKDNLEIQLIKNPKRIELFSLWIQKNDNPSFPCIQQLCLASILRQGYTLRLYTNYKQLQTKYQSYIKDNRLILEFIEEKEEIESILAYSDIFRFETLYKKGGIWIDMDLILLKRINLNNDTIISTEHTFQSGAFKSKELKTSSISLMKFIKNDKFLEKVLNKCYLNINSKKRFPFYNIFKDKLKTEEHVKKYQAEPNEFCPIPWWDTSEIYKNIEEYSTKYNVKIPNQKEILNTAIGVHLWNNITISKKLHENYEENSLYDKLIKFYLNN